MATSKPKTTVKPSPESKVLEAKVRRVNPFLGPKSPHVVVYYQNGEIVRESAPLSRYLACCQALAYNKEHNLLSVQEIS